MTPQHLATPSGVVKALSRMKGMVKAAVDEQNLWNERLEALRGKGDMDSAYARVRKIGESDLLRHLNGLSWPPCREDFEARRRKKGWPRSKQEIALAAYPDLLMRSELSHIFLGTLQQRDRIKSETRYWELLGIHPDDLQDHEYFDPMGGWDLFVVFKTCDELATRFAAAGSDEERVYTALAGAFRSMAQCYLGCGDQPSLKIMRQEEHYFDAPPTAA